MALVPDAPDIQDIRRLCTSSKFREHYLGELAVLPASDPEQVAHHVALLLAVELGHVLVSTHL